MDRIRALSDAQKASIGEEEIEKQIQYYKDKKEFSEKLLLNKQRTRNDIKYYLDLQPIKLQRRLSLNISMIKVHQLHPATSGLRRAREFNLRKMN